MYFKSKQGKLYVDGEDIQVNLRRKDIEEFIYKGGDSITGNDAVDFNRT